ncbi:MAG: LysR family transcriptional regulator [Rhizobacter sp.]
MATDIRTTDLNLLKALDALLDERSVTRAAERLALTQPAVSGMLTRLRDTFGDALFVRSQRGIVPTLRALELAGPVKQLLQDAENLLRPSAFVPADARMTLTIASTDYAMQAVLVPFLAALRRQAPGIRVAVLPVDDARLPVQMERGEIDLSLIAPDDTPEALHARRLFDEHYVCVMRDDHPAADEPLTLDRFCALDQALVSYTGGAFRGVTDDALAALGRERRVTLSVKSFLLLPEILRHSDLIAVVPSRLARQASGLRIVAPPVAVPGFTKTLAWHERTHCNPGHRWLRELMFETCGEPPAH